MLRAIFPTGRALHEADVAPIQTAVLTRWGLILATADGPVGRNPKNIRSSRFRTLIPHQKLLPASGETPAIWGVRRLAGSEYFLPSARWRFAPQAFDFAGVTALSTTGDDLLVAFAQSPNRPAGQKRQLIQFPAGTFHPIAILPDKSDEPIVGLADLNGRLIFSTPQSIFTIQNDMVLPLVDGLGGALFESPGGLIVHDAKTLRIFRLQGANY